MNPFCNLDSALKTTAVFHRYMGLLKIGHFGIMQAMLIVSPVSFNSHIKGKGLQDNSG